MALSGPAGTWEGSLPVGPSIVVTRRRRAHAGSLLLVTEGRRRGPAAFGYPTGRTRVAGRVGLGSESYYCTRVQCEAIVR